MCGFDKTSTLQYFILNKNVCVCWRWYFKDDNTHAERENSCSSAQTRDHQAGSLLINHQDPWLPTTAGLVFAVIPHARDRLCSGWLKATCSALLPRKELNKGLLAAAPLWRSIFQHNPAAIHNLLWQLGATAPGKLKRWFGVFFYLFSGVDQTKLSWPKIEFGLDSKEILLTTYCLILSFLCFTITNLANIYIYCDER